MNTDSVSRFIKNSISVQSQITGIILFSVFLALLFYQPITHFKATDPKPEIKPIVPVQATVASESIVQVSVGMNVINFPVFDIVTNNFTIEAILWFEFDPSLIPVETVNKFSFEKGTILKISEPEMKLVDNKLFIQYPVSIKFTTSLDHRAFPLSDHRIYLTLTNNQVTPQEMIFKSSSANLTIGKNIHVEGWKPISTAIETGYIGADSEKKDLKTGSDHPAALFMIDFAKGGIRKVFIILLPLLIIYFVSLFTLAIKPIGPSKSTIVTLAVGAVTGMIAYRFVIDKIIPDVAYFTLADHIFNLFLTAIFIIFLLNIFIMRSKPADNFILLFKGIAYLTIQLTVMAILFYLLVYWLNY